MEIRVFNADAVITDLANKNKLHQLTTKYKDYLKKNHGRIVTQILKDTKTTSSIKKEYTQLVDVLQVDYKQKEILIAAMNHYSDVLNADRCRLARDITDPGMIKPETVPELIEELQEVNAKIILCATMETEIIKMRAVKNYRYSEILDKWK